MLGQAWIFQGGTCLKKCYIETYRLLEDLDFTVAQGGPIEPSDVAPALMEVLEEVRAASGIDFFSEAKRNFVSSDIISGEAGAGGFGLERGWLGQAGYGAVAGTQIWSHSRQFGAVRLQSVCSRAAEVSAPPEAT